MSETKQTTSFVKALIDFFGMTPSDAVKEYKPLTPKDKTELSDMLRSLGYTWPDVAKAQDKARAGALVTA